MTSKILRGLHLLAICVFVGSIPAHIVLGSMAASSLTPNSGNEAFALYFEAKYALTVGLTMSGIGLTVLSGVMLGTSKRSMFKDRWLRLKLLLVAAIVINGTFVLTPLAEQMRDLAVAAIGTNPLTAEFQALEHTEAIAGAINLALIITVVFVTALKPRLGTSANNA